MLNVCLWYNKPIFFILVRKKDGSTKTFNCLYSRTNVSYVKTIQLAKEMFRIDSDDKNKVTSGNTVVSYNVNSFDSVWSCYDVDTKYFSPVVGFLTSGNTVL